METSTQTRAAAFAVAATIFGGIIYGIVIPDKVSNTQVRYGTWVDGDPATRRCVEGTVWVDDEPRAVAQLPLIADGAAPYCIYRACFEQAQIPADGEAVVLPGMDPLFAEIEVPWQEPWPPLEVWCGDNSPSNPGACACAPIAASNCEVLTTNIEGVESWGPAGTGYTLSRGKWRGDCVKSPCTVLAGRGYFPAECTPPVPPPVETPVVPVEPPAPPPNPNP